VDRLEGGVVGESKTGPVEEPVLLKVHMSTPVYKNIVALLDSHGCVYETQHHEPTLTSQIAADVRGVSLESGAKAIVAKGHKTGNYFLFVMPAHLKLWGGAAKRACGEAVGFAKNCEELTGCVPGSVPPFGSVIGLKTYVDPRLKENEIIHFNAGSLTDSVSMRCEDYLKIEQPVVVEIAKEIEG